MCDFKLLKGLGLEDDMKLYRYLSLSQFLEFMEKRKIYLTNINYWEDTWEAPAEKIKLIDNDNIRKKELIGQSWSMQDVSDALWRIYSKEKEGIMIQTTVKKFDLIKGIKIAMLAPVIYYENLEEILNKFKYPKNYNGIPGVGFLKRKAFEHEKEVRLITLNDSEHVEGVFQDSGHFLFELNPIEFIEGIIIDPRAEEWYVDTIKYYCKRAGLLVRTLKSDLYSSLNNSSSLN